MVDYLPQADVEGPHVQEVIVEGHHDSENDLLASKGLVASEVIDLDSIPSPYCTCSSQDSRTLVVHVVFALLAIARPCREDLPLVYSTAPKDALEVSFVEFQRLYQCAYYARTRLARMRAQDLARLYPRRSSRIIRSNCG